jgi:hypothetical protein
MLGTALSHYMDRSQLTPASSILISQCVKRTHSPGSASLRVLLIYPLTEITACIVRATFEHTSCASCRASVIVNGVDQACISSAKSHTRLLRGTGEHAPLEYVMILRHKAHCGTAPSILPDRPSRAHRKTYHNHASASSLHKLSTDSNSSLSSVSALCIHACHSFVTDGAV